MNTPVRNLLVLGAAWGLLLAAPPAVLMAGEPDFFVLAALLGAALAGALGTLAAARSLSGGRRGLRALLGFGARQGLSGGAVAAGLLWGMMAVSIAGVSPAEPGGLSALMRPAVFVGSFFVALSVFVYALLAGLLLGPVLGLLAVRLLRKGEA
ncbi:hypothetical protein Rxycam_01993 [Rubrobacter xylanophilus DSM 9941]|uniref:hypothetical protein n=1 Tax=Rubrobacter xylanophilus TaxID=49319 RepID=UPI001C63C6DD|nr:hypothetical protein [Rubrobacter xylanophilus]QYJ16162.1 hypothetical protein Rxycam_01993 [Rubrobacter xylanophilus DSM 9941]